MPDLKMSRQGPGIYDAGQGSAADPETAGRCLGSYPTVQGCRMASGIYPRSEEVKAMSRNLRPRPGICNRSRDGEAMSRDPCRRPGMQDDVWRSMPELEMSRQDTGIYGAVQECRRLPGICARSGDSEAMSRNLRCHRGIQSNFWASTTPSRDTRRLPGICGAAGLPGLRARSVSSDSPGIS
jgi:hypothetical protein